MRTGLIAKKSGMTCLFTKEGKFVPVTMLSVDNCVVVGKKTRDKDGYDALVMGFNAVSKPRFSKSESGVFQKHKLEPKKTIKEFRVDSNSSHEVGESFSVEHFEEGQFVDVTAVSKGKGFAGAMKRHNFGGLRASHGVSVSHRSHGSTGQCQDPGKVFKGKKMAGHLGSEKVTVQSLEIIKVDSENGQIFVKGGVPGSRGSVVFIKDAVKKFKRLES